MSAIVVSSRPVPVPVARATLAAAVVAVSLPAACPHVRSATPQQAERQQSSERQAELEVSDTCCFWTPVEWGVGGSVTSAH